MALPDSDLLLQGLKIEINSPLLLSQGVGGGSDEKSIDPEDVKEAKRSHVSA